MLKRIIKPTLSVFSRNTTCLFVNTMRPSFAFANQVQAFSKLRNVLQEEIQHEQKNKQDLSQYVKFFEGQNWKISYDDVQVEISKKKGPYNLRVLFNARAPMGDYADQSQPENQQEDNQDFSEITVFINKEGVSKWLVIDVMVLNGNQSQIATASFINNYEAEKAERKKGRSVSGYNGPDMSSLDDKLNESLFSFIEAVGVNGQLLIKASQFSVDYEQKFYLGWLKDLKSIV